MHRVARPLARRLSKRSVRLVLLFFGYLVGAQAGFELVYAEWTPTIWPPAGIALGALLLAGKNLWPAVAAGSFVANALGMLLREVPAGVAVPAASWIAVGNVIQVLVGWHCVTRFCGVGGPLASGRNAFVFVVLGCFAASAVGAVFGGSVMCFASATAWSRFEIIWSQWWLGNVGGSLVFAPLVLVIARGRRRYSWGRLAEALLVMLALALLLRLSFTLGDAHFHAGEYALVHALFPLLGWTLFRLGREGAVAANVVLVGSATHATVSGHGPFSAAESVLSLQSFAGLVAATNLVVAGVLAERQRTASVLRYTRDSLRRYGDQLRAMSRRMHVVREEESARIAREIHDELGQCLSALKMDAAWLQRRLTQDEPLRKRVAGMGELIDRTIATVRRVAGELYPRVLEDLGLAAAVDWQIEQFEKSAGIPCQPLLGLDDAEVDRERAFALFRILQESLTNITRHAGAESVRVRLFRDGDALVLRVVDDGRGIRGEQAHGAGSLGLASMRERVADFGGRLRVRGLPGIGTAVEARLPDGAAG